MATITISSEQAQVLLDDLDGMLGGCLESGSLITAIRLEQDNPAAFEITRQLVDAPRDGDVTLEVADVAAAMRALVAAVEYRQEGMEGQYIDLLRGPVCAEDATDYPESVREAVERMEHDGRKLCTLIAVLAELSVKRAGEVEWRPLNEVGTTPDALRRAQAEFLGSAA